MLSEANIHAFDFHRMERRVDIVRQGRLWLCVIQLDWNFQKLILLIDVIQDVLSVIESHRGNIIVPHNWLNRIG